ncbi:MULTISPECIES: dTMP kinase [Sutcliffiella]|uniref:Thymidylate kinase n=1 Tax=Sutcliffiella cohnii TaxID=33932 RepID=A0A223KVP7_9BACI|nr:MULTISPECIES: dTMP kinase [Sutcliffiella]AST93559.1 dTMP kinase [Sutcliffiella cohnii]WBL14747.1 dTMP kinase [Sutcliffiella sp. NC1]
MEKEKGRLIVVCGIDGTGKTTIVNYINKLIEELGFPCNKIHSITAGDNAGEVFNFIREKVDADFGKIEQAIGDFLFINFLFRYKTMIQPSISEGINVVCDRYLYSHIANQKTFGVNTGLYESIENAIEPDLIIYLANDVQTSISRVASRSNKDSLDRNIILLSKIKSNLEEMLKDKKVVKIDSSMNIENVKLKVRENIIKLFEVNLIDHYS